MGKTFFALFLSVLVAFIKPASGAGLESLQTESIKEAFDCPYVYRSVNVITGEYCENETDLRLAGPHPLSFKRSYISQDPTAQGWHFNHPNILFYDKKVPKEFREGPIQYEFDKKNRLKTISSKDSSHRLQLQYNGKEMTELEVSSEDGRYVRYTFSKAGPGSALRPRLLERVRTSTGTDIAYQYVDHPFQRKKLVAKREEMGGRYLITEYYDTTENDVGGTTVTIPDPCRDARIGRVKLQKAPVGPDDTPIITSRFFYEQGRAIVYDALNHKTTYRYGENRKLTAIENYLEEDSPYRTERFFWDDAGQLINRSIEDASGSIQSCQTFVYDLNGNIIKHTQYGNLTGTRNIPIIPGKNGLPVDNGVESYNTVYRYSDDNRRQLVRKRSDNGTETRYRYLPESALLEAVLTYDDTSLRIRQFYRYNTAEQLVEIIVDDGTSEDSDSLAGATERRLTRFTSRQTAPGLGMPEVIEEKYIDLASGNEILQKRTVVAYSTRNEALRQDIFDANGEYKHTLFYEYDDNGHQIRATDAEGNYKETFFDSYGNPLEAATKDTRTRNQYDFSNRLIRSEEETGKGPRKQTAYRYDRAGNKIACIDLFGNETLFEYDPLGRCVKSILPLVKDPSGGTIHPEVSQEYDIMDRIISFTDANGNTTRTEYNTRGNPAAIVYADGSRELFEYNPDGSLRKAIAKNGTYTLYTRDFLSRVIGEDVCDGAGKHLLARSKTYSAFRLFRETDQGGRTTSYLYDGAGRQIGVEKNSDDGLARAAITYDALGRVEKRNNWYGEGEADFSSAAIERDSNDNISVMNIQNACGDILKKTPFKKEESAEAQEPAAAYNYDYYNDLGQNVLQAIVTDSEGCTAITTFNAVDKPEKIERKNNLGEWISSEEFLYDAAGNKVREIHRVIGANREQHAYIHSWTYGPNHRLESAAEAYGTPQEKTIFYTYYPDGALESMIKPDGVVLTYRYTPTGKISRLTSSDKSIYYAYSYDSLDRLSQVEDRVGNTLTARIYDDRDNLIYERLGNGFSVENRYDLSNRRTELILPDSSKVSYMYNAAYLTSIERKTAQNQTLYTHRYTRYNLNGALAEAECVGKSGNIFYDYDEKDRLTAIQSPCWSETLEYNGMGNTISIRLEDPSGAVSSAYQYDCRQQLTRETGIAENSYAYDSISNRTAKNDMDYYVDALTQLTAAGDTLYAYDPNGNLLETKNNKALTHYEYDALNRMTQATQERSFKVAFTYDALNRRLSKTSYRWNPEENRWREAGALRYLYDESNEIGAVNKSGEIKELRVLGTGLGAEIGAAIAIELDGSIYAPIHDHRGSVCCLIDASSGKAVEWTRYSAFGEEHTQSTLNNPWRFSGKRTDKETGLLFFGKRYYDPDIGRWITKDPLGTPEGINRYAFAQNQPIDRIDLYGLFSIGSRLNSIWSWIKQAYQFANTGIHNFQKNYSFDNYIRPTLDKIAPAIIGQPILYLAGYYNDKSETGVHGRGELSDKVRITLINGILNARVDYKATMDNVSEAHGGVNIHYIFDASDGWTWDLFKAFFAKAGYKASQAYQLTETWRAMIAEMGGTDGGGTIIHYAHSLGGTHTQTALGMLSPEERKMIHVYTFGSASMIYDSGLETIVNFISVRDAIAICDPIGFLSGLFGFRKEVNTVGNWFGIPLIDHMIGSRTYREIIKALGKQFLQLYVEGAV